MKVWVVGSQGMLGSALLAFLKKEKIEAVGTSRSEADVTQMTQLVKMHRLIQPTHIINCTAFTNVDGAESNAAEAFAVNVEGAVNLALLAKSSGDRFIHVSTDYVFDGKKQSPYVEEEACSPINQYGKSKREGELKILQMYPKACIVRTSWLFGSKGKNFISSILQWLKEKEELMVVTDQSSRPTYCHDLARAIILLANAEGIVHFANDGVRSRFQIAEDVLQAAHALGFPVKCRKIIPVPSSQFPTPAARPEYTALDTSKYYQLTRQQPRSWNEILNEYVHHALSL
jgi:dTDP-4-dehydrorhamnose reductase